MLHLAKDMSGDLDFQDEAAHQDEKKAASPEGNAANIRYSDLFISDGSRWEKDESRTC